MLPKGPRSENTQLLSKMEGGTHPEPGSSLKALNGSRRSSGAKLLPSKKRRKQASKLRNILKTSVLLIVGLILLNYVIIKPLFNFVHSPLPSEDDDDVVDDADGQNMFVEPVIHHRPPPPPPVVQPPNGGQPVVQPPPQKPEKVAVVEMPKDVDRVVIVGTKNERGPKRMPPSEEELQEDFEHQQREMARRGRRPEFRDEGRGLNSSSMREKLMNVAHRLEDGIIDGSGLDPNRFRKTEVNAVPVEFYKDVDEYAEQLRKVSNLGVKMGFFSDENAEEERDFD